MGGTPCFVHHLFAVVKGKKKTDRWFSAVLMYMIWEACIGGTSCTPDIICLTLQRIIVPAMLGFTYVS
jgi:hypothetical protein